MNRWENGRAVPNKLAQSTLYNICKEQNVPVYDMVLEKIKNVLKKLNWKKERFYYTMVPNLES